MSQTTELLKEIKQGLSQESTSKKDEVRVMQSMLNDKEYKVEEYANDGSTTTYCPAEEARDMISSVIAGAAKLSNAEATALANTYEFTKSEAASFVGISKEFINTYLETGRKLGFGGRKDANIFITSKEIPETVSKVPTKVGVDENGKDIYQSIPSGVPTPAHKGLKVNSSCPPWVK